MDLIDLVIEIDPDYIPRSRSQGHRPLHPNTRRIQLKGTTMAITYNPETADAGAIEKTPAADIVIDLNVRQDIRLDKSFVSNVRVYGHLQPPVGYRDEDGKVHITIGQRRVSAALEIGWPVVPVLIKPRADAEADRHEEQRILVQLAENEQRASLHDSEIAAGYKQLALIGVSEDQIARKTNSAKGRVTTALKVAASEIATAAIEKHELTLDQAAILVEFENDEKALAELQTIAKERPEQLEHAAQQQRSAVARQRDGQSIADKARAEGWEIVYRTDRYSYGLPSGYTRIDSLWRADDPEKKRLTVDDVKDSAGRVAYIDTMGHGDTATVLWVIKDHKKHGFASYYDNTGPTKGPLTDEEKAARRQKRTDKAEMIDATVVRRAWIRDTLLNPSRKKYPDDAIAWITRSLWHAATNPKDSYSDGIRFTAEQLLGVKLDNTRHIRNPDTGDYFRTMQEGEVHFLLADVTDHMRFALAITLGRVEELAGNPKAQGFGQDLRLAGYLRQLEAWGYTLADVEQRIVTNATNATKKGNRK